MFFVGQFGPPGSRSRSETRRGMELYWWLVKDNEPENARIFMIQEKLSEVKKFNFFTRFFVGQFWPSWIRIRNKGVRKEFCWWPVEDNEPGQAWTFMTQEKPSVLQKNFQQIEKSDFFTRFFVGQFCPTGCGTPDGTLLVTCVGQWARMTGLSWYRTFRSLRKKMKLLHYH
jgi:hypothetical protein